MNRRLLYNLHRWIFTLVGIFLITQLLSGILMEIPATWLGTKIYQPENPVADYNKAVISPAGAITGLETGSSSPGEIKNVRLVQIDEQLLYSITLPDNSKKMVNAETGALFNITPELAESLIRNRFRIAKPLSEIEHIKRHGSGIPWGSPPAFRMTFTGSPSESYYLLEDGLAMYRSSPVTVMLNEIMSLHSFKPLKLVTHDVRVRKGLLVLVFSIALAGTIIGMLLIFSRWKR